MLDSDDGLLVDLPEKGLEPLSLVLKHPSLSQWWSVRVETTLHASFHRSCLASAFPPPLLLRRLIRIMSLNRTK